MKRKMTFALFALGVLFSVSAAFAAQTISGTIYEVKNGKKGNIKFDFAKSTVNGVIAKNAGQEAALIAAYSVFSATTPVVVVPNTPTALEVFITTSAILCDEPGDIDYFQTKDGAVEALRTLISYRDAYSAAGMNAKQNDLDQQIGFLGSKAKNLP